MAKRPETPVTSAESSGHAREFFIDTTEAWNVPMVTSLRSRMAPLIKLDFIVYGDMMPVGDTASTMLTLGLINTTSFLLKSATRGLISTGGRPGLTPRSSPGGTLVIDLGQKIPSLGQSFREFVASTPAVELRNDLSVGGSPLRQAWEKSTGIGKVPERV